ncbi:MAG: hypothetical protein SFV15_21875 [Polyangiaceae bacterium]|nr:hypothetical protein [Polyangiaceae bacterium]
MIRHWWWLLVLAVGPLELGAHLFFSRRAPGLDDYRALQARVTALRKPGDVVIIAPRWAEPIARTAWGDALLPIAELGRLDLARFERVVLVTSMGQVAPELSGFARLVREAHGPFVVEVLKNPGFAPVKADLNERVVPELLAVAVVQGSGERSPCIWSDSAVVRTGGLGGPAALPRERFQCVGGEDRFVGISILDDQEFRPRRCIWAHPPDGGYLELSFSKVPRGRAVIGAAGLSYLLTRDGVGSDVSLEVLADGVSLGTHRERDTEGWQGFRFELPGSSQESSEVELTFRVSSVKAENRDFCFQAEVR